MQQTTSREFSIIESSDPFLPEALNDNTRKIEAALDAHETQTKAVTDALAARITTLEGHKMVCGTYIGDGTKNRLIPLPFEPKAVLVFNYHTKDFLLMAQGLKPEYPNIYLQPNGFLVNPFYNTSSGDSNIGSNPYTYVALC